jgi:hypothetical protein
VEAEGRSLIAEAIGCACYTMFDHQSIIHTNKKKRKEKYFQSYRVLFGKFIWLTYHLELFARPIPKNYYEVQVAQDDAE